MSDLFRVYLDPAEIGPDDYPYAWHGTMPPPRKPDVDEIQMVERQIAWEKNAPAIKDLVREQAGHRCVRCGHPYRKGEHGRGEWSPCDVYCTHGDPVRHRDISERTRPPHAREWTSIVTEAQWRILTVHHLNGVKHDCRWWNLVALCQRCHLSIQGRVVMERIYPFEHSDWFKPYVAGYYAAAYLGEELSREQVMTRLDELLSLERMA